MLPPDLGSLSAPLPPGPSSDLSWPWRPDVLAGVLGDFSAWAAWALEACWALDVVEAGPLSPAWLAPPAAWAWDCLFWWCLAAELGLA